MQQILFVFVMAAFAIPQTSLALEALPNPATRQQIVADLAAEMGRLDGEALFVRKNRPQHWIDLVQKLRREAARANTWLDFHRVLNRLNQSYPNLHSNLRTNAEIKALLPNLVRPKIDFQAEWLEANSLRFVISNIDNDLKLPADRAPQVGDLLLAINGRSIKDWTQESFEFCKFPLKSQCDFIFPLQFKKEFLSWNRAQGLSYTVNRNGKTVTVSVPLEESSAPRPATNALYCKYEENRYDDFKLVYAGNRLCIYESPRHPDTAVMRITSFNYSSDSLEENEPINSVVAELKAITPWWTQHATWKHLAIDLIDNHGGNAPIPYYQMLLQKDFQEQYVVFKKTPEMNDATLRGSFFWDSVGQEIWFQKLVTSGLWDRLRIGEYTPPVPMFCVNDDQDCTLGKFSPHEHPFKGDVRVLLNQWCVSSCDGFVYQMKAEFKDKAQFFGHPQAADSAYSRVALHVVLDNNAASGFKILRQPLYDDPPNNMLFTQTIVITQSVTAEGEIVSGLPVPVDFFVPNLLSDVRWPNKVLKAALAR